jgi:HlyD family secretion protein
MHKPIPQILILLAVIIGAGGIWYVDIQRDKEHSALSGFFESQPTDVSSRIGGRVADILVTEGDPVRRGQVLMQLDAGPDQKQLLAKRDAAQQAHEALLEVLNGPRPEDIRKQRAAVAEAQADLDELLAGPRPQEIAEARAAALAAEARYAASLRGPTPEETAEAKAKYDSAVAAEVLAQKEAVRYAKLYSQEAVTKEQNDEVQASLAEATANRKDMQETWRRSREGTPADELEEARQSYLQAKASLNLLSAGSRPEDIDAARARLEQAQAALDELLAGSRPEDIAQARLAYDAAEAQVQSLRIDVRDRDVRAPFDGIVDNIPVSVGDLVNPSSPLLRLDNPADIWVRVYVPESELANVTAGVDAELRVDGVPDTLPAYVESVASQGEFTPANLQSPDERGKQVFAVRLRLKNADPRVKSGMDVSVVRIGTWKP